jgi:hypothetical protein
VTNYRRFGSIWQQAQRTVPVTGALWPAVIRLDMWRQPDTCCIRTLPVAVQRRIGSSGDVALDRISEDQGVGPSEDVWLGLPPSEVVVTWLVAGFWGPERPGWTARLALIFRAPSRAGGDTVT